MVIGCHILFLLLTLGATLSCETRFEGFGVHLGGMHHLDATNEQIVRTVVDKLYMELQLRHFRTSYEPYFSPTEGVYDIRCHSADCSWSWELLLQVLSEPPYNVNTSVIASVWSPPFYMMDMQLVRLKREYETRYLYFIRNVTRLIYEEFGIEIEAVSPVNEPENAFATWDHCNMDPHQLCRMVQDFNDPLISLCPENSYFSTTLLYSSYKNPLLGIDCMKSCSILATHGYALNVDPTSENFLLAHYDLFPYQPLKDGGGEPERIWQTEVSSTWKNPNGTQMEEGLDLATNILNFVGVTCVERYYFWYAFTSWISGQSLIWGVKNEATGEWELTYPKKYFIYNHFTNASAGGNKTVRMCSQLDFVNSSPPHANCLKFDEENSVIVNKGVVVVYLNLENFDCNERLCCTNEQHDMICYDSQASAIPPLSVCSCKSSGLRLDRTTVDSNFGNRIGYSNSFANALIVYLVLNFTLIKMLAY